jgi:hypothetical protein
MKSEAEKYQRLVNRFIALANNMKDEGLDPAMVSDALMFSSGVYATYVAAGNTGGLTETGIDKVAERYRQRLTEVQSVKKQGGVGDGKKKKGN